MGWFSKKNEIILRILGPGRWVLHFWVPSSWWLLFDGPAVRQTATACHGGSTARGGMRWEVEHESLGGFDGGSIDVDTWGDMYQQITNTLI